MLPGTKVLGLQEQVLAAVKGFLPVLLLLWASAATIVQMQTMCQLPAAPAMTEVLVFFVLLLGPALGLPLQANMFCTCKYVH
jgi:hypothetical protein